MRTQEQLSLPDGFESPHPPLPHPDHLMGLLYPIVGIPTRYMDDLRHHLAMGDWVAPQLVGHDLPGLSAMAS